MRSCMHTSLLPRCSPVGPSLHLGRRRMELNHSLWRVSADGKPTTDHLSQEKVFNLFISYVVHCGLRLSDVVCIHAGLCEHSGPLHSLTAFLSDLISFSQCHLAWSDNHNRFLGEASAAPEEQGGEILRGGGGSVRCGNLGGFGLKRLSGEAARSSSQAHASI